MLIKTVRDLQAVLLARAVQHYGPAVPVQIGVNCPRVVWIDRTLIVTQQRTPPRLFPSLKAAVLALLPESEH